MIDILNLVKFNREGDNSLCPVDPSEEYILATIHRQENTDYKDQLQEIASSLQNLRVPTSIPSHSSTSQKVKSSVSVAEGESTR